MQLSDLINAVRSFTNPKELRKYYTLNIIEPTLKKLGVPGEISQWNHFYQIYGTLSPKIKEDFTRTLPQSKIPLTESLENQFLLQEQRRGIEIFERIGERYPDLPVLFPTKLNGCKRELFLQYHPDLRRPQLSNLGQMTFFSIPNYIHEGIQHRMKLLFHSNIETEKTVEKRFGSYIIQGRVDCYLPNENIIFEIKTYFPSPYRSTQPKQSDVAQLMVYLDICNSDLGFILTVNRRNGTMKTFEYKRDQELIQRIHKECERIVNEIINPNTLPENVSGFGWKTGMCKDCSFSVDNEGFCHKDLDYEDIRIP